MVTDKTIDPKKAVLRRNAEAWMRQKPGAMVDLSPDETRMVVQELHTHQVELEMQNEELRNTQEKLLESQKMYTDLYDFAPVGYITINNKGLIIRANLTVADMLGEARKNLLNKLLTQYIVKADQDIYFFNRKNLLETKEPQTCELRMQNVNEQTFHVQLKSTISSDVDGDSGQFRAVITDITKRKQAEQELNRIFDMSLDMIATVDFDGYFRSFNQAVSKTLGYTEEEIRSKPFIEFVHPDDRESAIREAEKIARGDSTLFCEKRYQCKDGTFKWLSWNVVPATVDKLFYCVIRDITERKNAEEQLLQSHKIEAIGTLAGGIAHDFNNILSIIIGNMELAIDDVPEYNPARGNLEEIKTASLRARDVVKQLLSFSRKTIPQQQPINISPIIKDSIKFLRSSIPTNIEIHKSIPDESGIISADPAQIQQVIMNLCTNAAQAMSENGGILEVSLSIVDIDKDVVIQNIELNPGQYVKIFVSDTGDGIAKEHLDKIFDPYFTTKEVGKGNGFGLSVVHGIVKNHNGGISVDSQCGKGTTFNVFLPVVKEKPEFEKENDTTTPTGNERILFVEDEKSIVEMTSLTLERLGYTVTATTSSPDMLEIFRAQPDNFDLIISDIFMPKLTGDKLAQELHQIRPDIPIIIYTGHSDRIKNEKVKEIGVQAVVMKPIEKSEFAKIIRKVLDKS